MRVCDFANRRVPHIPFLKPGKHTPGENGASRPGSSFNKRPRHRELIWCVREYHKTFPDHYNAVSSDNVVLVQRLIAVLTT